MHWASSTKCTIFTKLITGNVELSKTGWLSWESMLIVRRPPQSKKGRKDFHYSTLKRISPNFVGKSVWWKFLHFFLRSTPGGGWKDEGSEWGDSFESHHVMKIIWWFFARIQKVIKLFWVKISDNIAYLWIHFKNPTCLLPSPWVIAAVLRGSRIFAASWEKLSGGVDRSRRFGSEVAWNTVRDYHSAKFDSGDHDY